MQLVDYILNQIKQQNLGIEDRLPSLNNLMTTLNMSKETVLKGLQYLTEKGIIESVLRKGYYVKRLNFTFSHRICLVVDKMNILRDRFYRSFVNTIAGKGEIDVFFHHHNIKVFEKLIHENLNNYTHFAVITYFKEDPSTILNLIPASKRIIIDHKEDNLSGKYSLIHQDHQLDIYESLEKLLPQLSKYKQLILVTPAEASHAKDLIAGFRQFVKTYGKKHKIIKSLTNANMERDNAYITFDRYDLDDVIIIKYCKENNLKLGKDLGLISYNDTAVKEILEDGITVISIDFSAMGEAAAQAILSEDVVTQRIPAKTIVRKSL